MEYKQIEGGYLTGKIFSHPFNVACDICGKSELDTFVDGITTDGRCINMCESCFKAAGAGIGKGLGERYEKIKSETPESVLPSLQQSFRCFNLFDCKL